MWHPECLWPLAENAVSHLVYMGKMIREASRGKSWMTTQRRENKLDDWTTLKKNLTKPT